jgi:hypothetical protein
VVAPSKLAAMVFSQPCRDLADYWTSLRPDGALPHRAQIDPGAILALLPCLYLIELREDDTIFVRLAGTALRQLYGFEMTGRDVVTLGQAEHQETRRWRYLAAAYHPCAIWFLRNHHYASGAVDEVESLFLPLTTNATGVLPARRFIGIAASRSQQRWIAESEPSRLTTPHDFRFLDVGFGQPPSVHPPSAHPPGRG